MAVEQLRDAEAKVRALLESSSSSSAESSAGSNVALALQGLMDAAQHLTRPERAEGAASSLTTIRQAAKISRTTPLKRRRGRHGNGGLTAPSARP